MVVRSAIVTMNYPNGFVDLALMTEMPEYMGTLTNPSFWCCVGQDINSFDTGRCGTATVHLLNNEQPVAYGDGSILGYTIFCNHVLGQANDVVMLRVNFHSQIYVTQSHENIWFPPSSLQGDLLICTGVFYGMPPFAREWFSYYLDPIRHVARIQGYKSEPVSQEMDSLLLNITKDSRVSIQHWPPYWPIFDKSLFLAATDCLFRWRNSYRWVIYADMDDIFVASPKNTDAGIVDAPLHDLWKEAGCGRDDGTCRLHWVDYCVPKQGCGHISNRSCWLRKTDRTVKVPPWCKSISIPTRIDGLGVHSGNPSYPWKIGLGSGIVSHLRHC
jgi:hypothetical protein